MERRSVRRNEATPAHLSPPGPHTKRYMGRMGFAASKDTRTTADTDQIIGKSTPGQPTFRHSSHTFQLRKITSEKRRDLHPLMYFQQHAVSQVT